MDQSPILSFDIPYQRVSPQEAPIVSRGQVFRVLLLVSLVLIGMFALFPL